MINTNGLEIITKTWWRMLKMRGTIQLFFFIRAVHYLYVFSWSIFFFCQFKVREIRKQQRFLDVNKLELYRSWLTFLLFTHCSLWALTHFQEWTISSDAHIDTHRHWYAVCVITHLIMMVLGLVLFQQAKKFNYVVCQEAQDWSNHSKPIPIGFSASRISPNLKPLSSTS